MEVYHCAIRICHDEWALHKPFPLNYTLRVDGSRLAMYLAESVHGGALLVQERKKERKSDREGGIRLRNTNHRCTSNTAEW